MRKVVVFVAVSLDGFLADAEGKVDWIRDEEEGTSDGGIYSSFIRSVDTVIMGYRTYHQIVCELSPEMWVYAGMRSYVVTHREIPSTREIAFTHQDPCDLVRMLKQQPGNDIWVCGGADLVRQLMDGGCIDRLHLSVIPVVLGSGIRLFSSMSTPLELKLIRQASVNGIVELVYERRQTEKDNIQP